MSMKQAYVEKVQARLNEWDAEIEKLKARAEEAEADAKITYYQQIEALRAYNNQMSELIASQHEEIASFETQIDEVDVIGRGVTPLMLRQRGGAIVNVSTYATFEPEAAFPTSGVFRAGLAAFTKLYADQYAAQGLRMNNVLPGFIDSFPEKDETRARIPMGRYGTVGEIAATIGFLASPGAAYITGQNLRVDGGITRSV